MFMKNEKLGMMLRKNIIPVLIAVLVMFLILTVIPLTSTSAKVFGGYSYLQSR